jgi:DNA-binding NtrC family response regulator
MLLLALQDGRVTRLGDTHPREVDVRLVAATHVDLEARVRDGSFRADLYARLNPAMAIELPPLRARRKDLRELCGAIIRRRFADGTDHDRLAAYQRIVGLDGSVEASFGVGKEPPPDRGVIFAFTEESWKRMLNHGWPGNLRELEYFLASTCLMTLESSLDAAEQGRARLMGARLPVAASLVSELLERSWVAPGADAETPLEGEPPELDTSAIEPRPQLKDVSRALEKALFERLFDETDGDFEAMAARLLVGDPATNARRVRMRFNQLGLRVRQLRRKG